MTWQEEAQQLRESQKSWQESASIIQKKYFPSEDKGRVLERIRSYIRRTPEYHKGKMIYEDKRDISEHSVAEYFECLKGLNNAIDELDTKQTNATIRIDDDKPIGIAFWGDWHLSARGVDYNRFEEDTEIIANTDGLYNIKMGDYGDNASPYVHPGSVFESIATPEMQDLGMAITPLEYSALKIDAKLSQDFDQILKKHIKDDVSQYYNYIRAQFRNIERSTPGKFDLVAGQVKTFYLNAKMKCDDQVIIFNQMADWLKAKINNCSLDACKVIIAFFIQNCEVFENATK